MIIVMPVYEDVEAAAQLLRELAATVVPAPYVVAVDDGSTRRPMTADVIATAGLDGLVLKLRRNVGHQRAIAIGLSYVGEHLADRSPVVVMDSDGEDVPLTIAALVAPLVAGDIDAVVARRGRRHETVKFRVFYAIYMLVFRILTGRRINFGNFMAFTPAAIRRLTVMQELWIHVAGCVLTSKLRINTVPIDRGPRYAGQSKMNFSGLVLHGFRALMVFAEDVLVRVGIACASIAALSLMGVVLTVILKLIGFATPGWFSLSLGILLLVLLQTGALTLMTLMLSGVVRSAGVGLADYGVFIDKVQRAGGDDQ